MRVVHELVGHPHMMLISNLPARLSFGSSVDSVGHSSNLGLRKVLGELNVAEISHEAVSKRPRN